MDGLPRRSSNETTWCQNIVTYGKSALVYITAENIQSEINKIQKNLKHYTAEDILNLDETGLFYCSKYEFSNNKIRLENKLRSGLFFS